MTMGWENAKEQQRLESLPWIRGYSLLENPGAPQHLLGADALPGTDRQTGRSDLTAVLSRWLRCLPCKRFCRHSTSPHPADGDGGILELPFVVGGASASPILVEGRLRGGRRLLP